jgi:phosphoribosylformylglycinamidine (FGAM) synthase-like enzyme
LAVTLSEMAIKSGTVGFKVDLEGLPGKTTRIDEKLFSESHSRFILEVARRQTKRVMQSFRRIGIPALKIGETTDDQELSFADNTGTFKLSLTQASETWNQTIPRMMEASSQ